MKAFLKTFVLIASLSSLVACTGNDVKDSKKETKTVNTAEILANNNLSPADKAEQLALAGEQLMTQTGFMYADLVFDQALSIDAKNKRAQFYKAMLATHMTLRGIMARVKPLAYQNPDTKNEYDDFMASEDYYPSLKKFLLDGTEDIKDEKDIQKFLDQVYAAQNSTRLFLKNNKSMDLTLNLSLEAIQSRVNDEVKQCLVKFIDNGEYEISNCDFSNITKVKVNRADLEVLQQVSAGMQIFLASLISYDATGGIAASRKYQGQEVSNKTLYKELAQNADFAKLRNPDALKNIIGMGSDAVAGVRWAVQFQKELCPKGFEDKTNRKGFLIQKGLCVNSQNPDGTKLEDVLKIADSVLLGRLVDAKIGRDEEIETLVRPISFLENPIADLKTLRPVYNNCDKVQSVSDDTLGGIFPRHDANEVLSSNSQCGYWY
jgi:hypothetical protein